MKTSQLGKHIFGWMDYVSVRGKILLLCVLFLLGICSVGILYWNGQSVVDTAFVQSRQHLAAANEARLFENRALILRELDKKFAASPSDEIVADFDVTFADAVASLKALETGQSADLLIDNLAVLSDALMIIGDSFHGGVTQQKLIGFTVDEGFVGAINSLTRNLSKKIKKAQRKNKKLDLNKLVQSVYQLDAAEKGYRLDPTDVQEGNFVGAIARIDRYLGRSGLDDGFKSEVSGITVEFNNIFNQLAAAKTARIALAERSAAQLDGIKPAVEAILLTVAEGAKHSDQTLANSRSRTARGMAIIIATTLLLGVCASLWIGASISRPLIRLGETMTQLASGEIDVDIPHTGGKTEIANMAKTVQVFKNNAKAQKDLETNQIEAQHSQQNREQITDDMIASFEDTIGQSLTEVRGVSGQLKSASDDLDQDANSVTGQALAAGKSVSGAAGNIEEVAAASGELGDAMNVVIANAEQSTDVATRARVRVGETVQTMESLANAAGEIGEVVQLIRDIAEQTNLLALNATIEAARAGESGRGFAVVAAEVKNLATQTSKATDDIASRIDGIQETSTNAVAAIDGVRDVIEEMGTIADTVRQSVNIQRESIDQIGQNVAEAARESRVGVEAMKQVEGAARNTQTAAGHVDDLAALVSQQAGVLDQEIKSFLKSVRSA